MNTQTLHVVIAFSAALTLIACGDDDGATDAGTDTNTNADTGADTSTDTGADTTTGGGTPAERWQAVCDSCGIEADECGQTLGCYSAWLNADAMDAYITCRTDCAMSDDACFVIMRSALTPDVVDEEIRPLCEEAETECMPFGGEASCATNIFVPFTTEYKDAVLECYETESCEDIVSCTGSAQPEACGG